MRKKILSEFSFYFSYTKMILGMFFFGPPGIPHNNRF